MSINIGHWEAMEAASKATQEYISKYGENPMGCGFAWVHVSVRGNNGLMAMSPQQCSRVAKELKSVGFTRAYGTKAYGGGYQLWNPSKSSTQDMAAKECGARAYVEVIKKYLPEGTSIHVEARLD
jgi:hypothetical protein